MRTQLRMRSIIKGLATTMPVLHRAANSAAGSPVGARYYYSVWLRHLVKVHAACNGLNLNVVGELGPGDGLGIGLCALLSGAQRYIGLDRLPFAMAADNLVILDELRQLFEARTPIPDDAEFPGVFPKLDNYAFPSHVLDDTRLNEALDAGRIARIQAALQAVSEGRDGSPLLSYAAPWDESSNIQERQVDLLLSQAVLEHVDGIDQAYAAMRRWLKPDGVMSHRIDYTCHGITRDWYGHWTVSEPMWRIARGRRAYFINRLPHSAHVEALVQAGFEIVETDASRTLQPAPAALVCIAHLTDDLAIRGAYLIARPQGLA